MLTSLLRDVIGVSGAAAIAYGAWDIYPPAGFIVGGALALVGAIIHAGASAPREEGEAE